MSAPTESAAGHEGSAASGDVRTARLLVVGQFVLIGLLVVLPKATTGRCPPLSPLPAAWPPSWA